MATKTKPRPTRSTSAKAAPKAAPKATSKVTVAASPGEMPRTPPATTEEFLEHIQALGERVQEHVDYMSGVEKLIGTSAEAKRRALAQFHARLSTLEQDLGRIKEDLQLG
jgi:hypothetical protein